MLNRDRQEMRRASCVLRAITAAIGNKIGPEFFTATSDDEGAAKAAFAMHQAMSDE